MRKVVNDLPIYMYDEYKQGCSSDDIEPEPSALDEDEPEDKKAADALPNYEDLEDMADISVGESEATPRLGNDGREAAEGRDCRGLH